MCLPCTYCLTESFLFIFCLCVKVFLCALMLLEFVRNVVDLFDLYSQLCMLQDNLTRGNLDDEVISGKIKFQKTYELGTVGKSGKS